MALDIMRRDAIQDLEQATKPVNSFRDAAIATISGLDRDHKGLKAREVCPVLGFDYLAEEDDEGDERGEEDCPRK